MRQRTKEGVGARVDGRTVKLYPTFWASRMSEELSLSVYYDDGPKGDLTNMHESIATALAETQPEILVHEVRKYVVRYYCPY